MNRINFLLILNVIFLGCSAKKSPVAVPENSSFHVLYKEDSREDIENNSLIKNAAATAILFEKSKLKLVGDEFKLNTNPLDQHYPLCPDEKFIKQPVLGFCSGVLIAPNRVLTAGHCMESPQSCETTKFIFGWNLDKSQNSAISTSQVYSCKKIIDLKLIFNKGIDYAIVELDRNVLDAEPVKLALTPKLNVGETITSYSYPLGLPLKVDTGTIIDSNPLLSFFKAEIDTFEGSSGSPLFDSKGELIGILSTGMSDFSEDDIYEVQQNGGCIRYHRCDKTKDCFGERFFKTSILDL